MKSVIRIVAIAMILGMGIVGCHAAAEGDVGHASTNVSGIR